MEAQMSRVHQTTYNAIFQHPAVHNLQWHDVRSMLNALTDVTEEHNGNLSFRRHGETLTVHLPKHKDLSDLQALMQIRHFLERSAPTAAAIVAEGVHLLVVIDHREARIYQTERHGTVPERIKPYDPDGSRRHLHKVDDDANDRAWNSKLAAFDSTDRT